MMATLRSFMLFLLDRTMAGARSRRKTGTHFSGSRSKTWNSKGRMTPKKEARPKGPGIPYSLRRNIVRNHQKTTAKVVASGKIHRHFRCFTAFPGGSATEREPDQHDSANSNDQP